MSSPDQPSFILRIQDETHVYDFEGLCQRIEQTDLSQLSYTDQETFMQAMQYTNRTYALRLWGRHFATAASVSASATIIGAMGFATTAVVHETVHEVPDIALTAELGGVGIASVMTLACFGLQSALRRSARSRGYNK